MNLLAFISGGIKLINFLIERARRRELIEQGVASATLKQLKAFTDAINKAENLRRNLTGADRRRLRKKYHRKC